MFHVLGFIDARHSSKYIIQESIQQWISLETDIRVWKKHSVIKKKLFQTNQQAELNELSKTVLFKVNIFYLLFYSIPFLYLIWIYLLSYV